MEAPNLFLAKVASNFDTTFDKNHYFFEKIKDSDFFISMGFFVMIFLL